MSDTTKDPTQMTDGELLRCGGGAMIPDDVRRTIKHALVAYWDANRWRYENDSMPHVDKAMDWIDNLPQPTQESNAK